MAREYAPRSCALNGGICVTRGVSTLLLGMPPRPFLSISPVSAPCIVDPESLVARCQTNVAVAHVFFLLFRHKNSLFRHNQFSTLFFSMKEAESGEIVIVSCIIDFKDKQV